MGRESSPQLTKPKTPKNKPRNSPEQRTNNEPNPLQCYKCQNMATIRIIVEGEVCRKCGQLNPDHHINDFQFPYKCTNCGGDHPVYTRYCES